MHARLAQAPVWSLRETRAHLRGIPHLPARRSISLLPKQKTVSVRRETGNRKGPRWQDSESSVEAAAKSGKSKTLWQSWLSLTPSTRLVFGISVAVFAVAGLYISDTMWARMPIPAEEADRAGSKPRLIGISVVDRKD